MPVRTGAAWLIEAALSLCVLAFGLALSLSPARAAEEILSFHADIQVMADAGLEVTETIQVRAEGRQIRRGIYRDFPTNYREPSGLLRTAGFELLETGRDGASEPHRTESISAGVRIYLGRADMFLRPGQYTYTIRYRTTRQLRFFDEFDELYWNVTGNFWSFPINRASATVRLPEGARIIRHSAYTGRIGSIAGDAAALQSGPRQIAFETTRRLGAGEGLTIAVAWPKGVVAPPGGTSSALRRLLDNMHLLVLALGLFGVPAYFLWAWRKLGQDPPKGTIIALFHPPEQLSPAGVSYLYYQGFKKKRGVSKAFLAALVALAVRRHIDIQDDGGLITVRRGPEPESAIRGPGEQRVYRALLGAGEALTFTRANGVRIASALSQFDAVIEKVFGEGRFFSRNIIWFIIGAALSLLTMIAFLALGGIGDGDGALVIPVVVFVVPGALLLSAGVRRLRGSVPGGSYIVGALALIAGAAVLAPVVLALFYFPGLTVLAPLGAFVLSIVTVMFFYLLPAPTLAGRRLMDEVEGFRMYLVTAESERMNMVGAPEMSVELFERYLPYAVGLDAERPWSEAYEAHVARALPDQRGGYHPAWYAGSRWNSSNIARSTSAVASGIASGMASAVPSSSSGSSGSGGGGSSGGGGGGGGGGGW